MINPPYYKRKPRDIKEHAWYAGENLEYFSGLFRSIGGFMHPGSQVLMILSEDCSLDEINAIAAGEEFAMVRETKSRIALNGITYSE